MPRVYIETYGCALNHADSAIMASVLRRRGYEIVNSIDEADVVIVNTCTVRLDTEQRMLKRLSVLRRLCRGKVIVVAGCMAKAQPYTVKSVVPEAILVSPGNVHMVYEAIEQHKDLIRDEPGSRKKLPPEPWVSGATAEVVIQDGCMSKCSFCIVKYARRQLKSQPIEDILRYVRKLLEKGVVEVRLTGQDTAVYGVDLYGKKMLPRLMEEVAHLLEDPECGCKAWLRVGMMSPDMVMEFWDELLDVMRHPCIYKFLHIPVQSGDDRVLKLMCRGYTVDEYRRMVLEARSRLPGVTIATDIIVGHPGEDEEAFENTVKLVKELMFERVHLAQYTPRPRTLAARLPQVPDPVKKERSRRLQKVIEEIGLAIHEKLVGSKALTVVTEYGRDGTLIARLYNYMQVILPPGSCKLGEVVETKIVAATWYDLRGVVATRCQA